MVKGITRQVVIVKNAGSDMFDQAIFLVRDNLVANGGVSEDSLLKEARQVCKKQPEPRYLKDLLFSVLGGTLVGVVWLFTLLI